MGAEYLTSLGARLTEVVNSKQRSSPIYFKGNWTRNKPYVNQELASESVEFYCDGGFVSHVRETERASVSLH